MNKVRDILVHIDDPPYPGCVNIRVQMTLLSPTEVEYGGVRRVCYDRLVPTDNDFASSFALIWDLMGRTIQEANR